jgi:hypothetical protein
VRFGKAENEFAGTYCRIKSHQHFAADSAQDRTTFAITELAQVRTRRFAAGYPPQSLPISDDVINVIWRRRSESNR